MPYLDELDVRVLPGKKYVLLGHFRYQCGEGVITVPKGFKTDFASIPRMARPIFTGHDRTRKAAVIHDYLYRQKVGDRKTADRIFLRAMNESGVPAWKRYAMYYAVRAGGWASWSS